MSLWNVGKSDRLQEKCDRLETENGLLKTQVEEYAELLNESKSKRSVLVSQREEIVLQMREAFGEYNANYGYQVDEYQRSSTEEQHHKERYEKLEADLKIVVSDLEAKIQDECRQSHDLNAQLIRNNKILSEKLTQLRNTTAEQADTLQMERMALIEMEGKLSKMKERMWTVTLMLIALVICFFLVPCLPCILNGNNLVNLLMEVAETTKKPF